MPRRPRFDPRADSNPQTRRVLAAFVGGRPTREIAAAEGVTVRRVQQVIAAALKQREADPSADFRLMHIARLEHALDAIGADIDAGDTRSIYAYIMILDRLDRLGQYEFELKNPYLRKDGAVEALEERFRRLDVARELIAAGRASRRSGEAGGPHLPQVLENTTSGEIADVKAQ